MIVAPLTAGMSDAIVLEMHSCRLVADAEFPTICAYAETIQTPAVSSTDASLVHVSFDMETLPDSDDVTIVGDAILS